MEPIFRKPPWVLSNSKDFEKRPLSASCKPLKMSSLEERLKRVPR